MFSQFFQEAVYGGTAGACGVLVGYPLDLIKTRLQSMQEIKSPLTIAKQLIEKEGFIGLYRGITAPVIAQFFMNGLSFAGDSLAMRILEPNTTNLEKAKFSNMIIAGMFGGFAQCIVLVPTDLVKCRLQTQQDSSSSSSRSRQNGPFTCAYNIVKAEGIRGLYSGFLVTAFREIPSYGIYFCVYKKVVTLFKDPITNETSKFGIIFAGGLAGCASWTCVYPCDVVKTNIQLYSVNNKSKVPNPIEMTMMLFRKHGIKVFLRGIEVTLIRAFPVNAITFYVYETLLKRKG